MDNLAAVHGSVPDLRCDILFLIREECVDAVAAGHVVLGNQAVQGCLYGLPECDLVRLDAVDHQDGDVLDVGLNVAVDVPDQVQKLQNIDILGFKASGPAVCCSLAAVDHPPDGPFQEGVDGVIEQVEGDQGVLVSAADLYCGLLEAGEQGPLSAGEVLS